MEDVAPLGRMDYGMACFELGTDLTEAKALKLKENDDQLLLDSNESSMAALSKKTSNVEIENDAKLLKNDCIITLSQQANLR